MLKPYPINATQDERLCKLMKKFYPKEVVNCKIISHDFYYNDGKGRDKNRVLPGLSVPWFELVINHLPGKIWAAIDPEARKTLWMKNATALNIKMGILSNPDIHPIDYLWNLYITAKKKGILKTQKENKN